MSFSFDRTDPDYRVYAEMVERQFGSVPNLTIASGDDRYAQAEQAKRSRNLGLLEYFQCGIQIHDAVRQIVAWHFGQEKKIERLLDFGTGYGCSTRFLATDFGPNRLWSADPGPGAARFQAEQFGVQTVPCTSRPQEFNPGVHFDCILAGSLFCHLPETTFTRWLWKLHSLLKPGGLLILGVHGEAALPEGVVMPRGGIHFAPLTDAPAFEAGEHGFTVVSDLFMQTVIVAVTGAGVSQRIAQGLCFSKDVYLVPKGNLKATQVPFRYRPIGVVDRCRWTAPEQMSVTGWAFDATEGERVTHVEAYYNGTLRASAPMNHDRLDVAACLGQSERAEAVRSGWDCVMDLAGETISPEQDWLLLRAVSSSGKTSVLLLDQPANIGGFEIVRWRAQGGESSPVIHFFDRPANGRFLTNDPEVSGWVAARDSSVLCDLRLEGRFGPIDCSLTERPDVTYFFPELTGVGFSFCLPLQYFDVPEPRLRFVDNSGEVVVKLDCQVEASALTSGIERKDLERQMVASR